MTISRIASADLLLAPGRQHRSKSGHSALSEFQLEIEKIGVPDDGAGQSSKRQVSDPGETTDVANGQIIDCPAIPPIACVVHQPEIEIRVGQSQIDAEYGGSTLELTVTEDSIQPADWRAGGEDIETAGPSKEALSVDQPLPAVTDGEGGSMPIASAEGFPLPPAAPPPARTNMTSAIAATKVALAVSAAAAPVSAAGLAEAGMVHGETQLTATEPAPHALISPPQRTPAVRVKLVEADRREGSGKGEIAAPSKSAHMESRVATELLPFRLQDVGRFAASPEQLEFAAEEPAVIDQPAEEQPDTPLADVAISLSATDALDVRLSADDPHIGARLEAESADLAADLAAIGAEVEAIRVEIRAVAAADRSPSGFSPEQGNRGDGNADLASGGRNGGQQGNPRARELAGDGSTERTTVRVAGSGSTVSVHVDRFA